MEKNFTNKYYNEHAATTNIDIHGKRCDGDPCYSIMFFPERENLLNNLIKTAILAIKKKYGTHIVNNKKICRIFGLLETIDDNEPKLFAIFFMIYWERNIANNIEEAFNGTGIFGINDKQHFKNFVCKLHDFIEKTIVFSYDKNNIIEIITRFVEAAKLEYIMGPFTT